MRNSCDTAETKSDWSSATASSRAVARHTSVPPPATSSDSSARPARTRRRRVDARSDSEAGLAEATLTVHGRPVSAAARTARGLACAFGAPSTTWPPASASVTATSEGSGRVRQIDLQVSRARRKSVHSSLRSHPSDEDRLAVNPEALPPSRDFVTWSEAAIPFPQRRDSRGEGECVCRVRSGALEPVDETLRVELER